MSHRIRLRYLQTDQDNQNYHTRSGYGVHIEIPLVKALCCELECSDLLLQHGTDPEIVTHVCCCSSSSLLQSLLSYCILHQSPGRLASSSCSIYPGRIVVIDILLENILPRLQ